MSNSSSALLSVPPDPAAAAGGAGDADDASARTPRPPLAATLILACLLPVATSFSTQPAMIPPNIIYILTDDLGYGDLGCYGQKLIATPHLDRLAAQGMRFTQHYAANTVCAPSRSSLLTGHHAGHARHRGNQRFVNGHGFRPEDVTFAEVVKSAGYVTAICGKWHLGDRADSTDIPHYHGFDYAYCVGYPYPDGGREHWPSHVFVNGRQTVIPENTDGRQERYMDDLYTNAAIEFIGRPRSGPFLLFLSLQGVHAPIDARVSPRYADRDWPEVEQRFASMVERIDENVGQLLAALERLGIDDQTLVLFSSDNGPHLEGGHDASFFASGGGLRGAKRDLYEGGIRVPLIARWPGAIKGGVESAHVSASWDMLPTFAELAGAEPPPGIDGISLAPTLLGREQREHAWLYWEFNELGGSQAVRWGDWKGVRTGVLRDGSAPLELYNLSADPAEESDVAAQNPAVVNRIRAMMNESKVAVPDCPMSPEEPR